MSKPIPEVKINGQRRKSVFDVPINPQPVEQQFRRRSVVGGTIKNPIFQYNNKETFDELQEESNKLKNFLKKMCTRDESGGVGMNRTGSNKSTSGAYKKLQRLKSIRADSPLQEIRRKSALSIKNETEPNRLISRNASKSRKATSNKELFQLVEMDERNLKRIAKISDSEISEDFLIENEEPDGWVIMPESLFCRLWEIIIFICLIYIFFIDTYQMGFVDDETDTSIIFGITIDIVFSIDFVITFFLAYYDFDENLITNRKLIIFHYLANGFIVDLLTAIPFASVFNMIQMGTSTNKHYQLIRIAKITRISKLSRALKLTKIFKLFKGNQNSIFQFRFFDDLNLSTNIKRFVRFLSYFLLFNHVSTCLWVFMGKIDYPNWIFNAGLQDADNMELYIHSLYFNFTTVFTIGYGDITSTNMYERLYNILIMLVGVLLYSFAITSLSNIVVKIDKKEKIYNKHVDLLEEIKMKYRLDGDLYKMLNRYLAYDLRINRINKKLVLNELPQQLRHNLTLEMYRNPIQNLNFFINAPNEFILKTVTLFRPLKMFKHELVIKTGNFLDEMYFVKRGRMLVLLPLNRIKKLKILHVYRNEHFGEIYMCKRMRCPVDLKVSSRECELFSLSKTDFIELNEEYPKIIQNIIMKSLNNTTIMELTARERFVKISGEQIRASFLVESNISPLLDQARRRSEFNIDDEFNLSPKKKLSDNSHLLKYVNNIEIETQKQGLIDYDPNNEPIMEEDSSVYSSFTRPAENSRLITKRTVEKNTTIQEMLASAKKTLENKATLNNNSGNILFKVNTLTHSSPKILTPSNAGQININYNINIQNNLNLNNEYFNKMFLNNQNTLTNSDLKDKYTKDISKEVKDIVGDVSREVSKDLSKDFSKDISKNISNNISKDVKDITTKDITKLEITMKNNTMADKYNNTMQNHTIVDNSKNSSMLEDDSSISILNAKDVCNTTIKHLQKPTTPRKLLINNLLRQDISTIQRDDSMTQRSLNDSLKEEYNKNQNSPEMRKLRHNSLFDFFTTKIKRRSDSSSVSNFHKTTPKVFSRNTSLLSKFNSLRREDMEGHRNSSKLIDLDPSKLTSSHLSPGKNRSSSFANMKRLSQLHFNDILDNMKKDAIIKKNPNGFLFRDFIPLGRETRGTGRAIEQQIDRLNELYENMLEALFKIKSRLLNAARNK
jgi:CRP-like cAMP-binding protein